MDTSISRIKEFSKPPAYSTKFYEATANPNGGMSPAKLDELDAMAARLLAGGSCAEWYSLPANQRAYVALAASADRLLARLGLTVPDAIDKLGWPDASAMVARWRNRRA